MIHFGHFVSKSGLSSITVQTGILDEEDKDERFFLKFEPSWMDLSKADGKHYLAY